MALPASARLIGPACRGETSAQILEIVIGKVDSERLPYHQHAACTQETLESLIPIGLVSDDGGPGKVPKTSCGST